MIVCQSTNIIGFTVNNVSANDCVFLLFSFWLWNSSHLRSVTWANCYWVECAVMRPVSIKTCTDLLCLSDVDSCRCVVQFVSCLLLRLTPTFVLHLMSILNFIQFAETCRI